MFIEPESFRGKWESCLEKWDPHEDIRAAMMVVDVMVAKGFMFGMMQTQKHGWSAGFSRNDSGIQGVPELPTDSLPT